MELIIFTFNDFYENTFILYDDSGECVIVDPGCNNADERKLLMDAIQSKNLKPVALINTHCHIDHVLGNDFVSKTYNLPLQAHKIEKMVLDMQPQVASMYGISYIPSPEITVFLNEGDSFKFGNTTLDILFIPGHAPGHICLYDKIGSQLIAGDTLFKGSIGRTDLPGGDHQTLLDNISTKLFVLPEDVVVYPGHGEPTTIGEEKTTNPFF